MNQPDCLEFKQKITWVLLVSENSLSLSLSQIPNPNRSLLAATTTKLGAIVTRNPRGGSGGGGGVN